MRRFHVLSSVIALLGFACTSPIHIVKPTPGIQVDPVTEVQAQFLPKFNPSDAWHIELDGKDLSGF